jgi:hypothetical protein
MVASSAGRHDLGRGVPFPKATPMSDITSILSAIGRGDPSAAEQLLPLVCDELRKLAAQRMARERLGDGYRVSWRSRSSRTQLAWWAILGFSCIRNSLGFR